MQQTNHLANLYLLVQVIDAGGLSAAAQELGMTRSLVSRRIIELEGRLGVRLLHRHARHFAITPVGEQVYRHAVAMCDAAHAATSAARAALNPADGLVRLGVDALLLPLAGEMLADFGTKRAQTRMTLGIEDAAALGKQRMDIVLHVGEPPTERPDITVHPLGSMRRVVVASPALLQRPQAPRHPDQLDDRDCLGYGARDWELRGAKARQRQPRIVTDHLPTLLEMARAGAGFAQLPMYLCRDDLASDRLRMVFEAFEARPLPLQALVRTEQDVDPATADFIAFAQQYLVSMAAQVIMPVG